MASWLDQARNILSSFINPAPSTKVYADYQRPINPQGQPNAQVQAAAKSDPGYSAQFNANSGTSSPINYSNLQSKASPSDLHYNSNNGVTGGGGGPNPGTNNSTNNSTNNINNQLQGGLSNIDQLYNAYMSQIQGQENQYRNELPSQLSAVDTNYAQAKTDVQNQQANKLAGLDTQATDTAKAAASQTQQARDLYRQLQQQNIAQLSGMGISSSSVAEALAENLGVETARRIAQTAQSAQDVYNGIAKERQNVNTFADQTLGNIDKEVAQKKTDIQNQFNYALQQLNDARNIAAANKADQRYQLLTNAQNAVAEIEKQAQQYAQALDMWKQQTQSGLAAAANKDWGAYWQNAMNSVAPIKNLNTQLQGAGMQANYTTNSQGYMVPGTISPIKNQNGISTANAATGQGYSVDANGNIVFQ